MVVGASGGIGRAVALAFAREGADVALAGRDEAALERVAENCRDQGVSVFTAPFDLADEEACRRAVAKVKAGFTAPNVLVNAAGVADSRRFADITVDLWRSLMQVHVEGPLVLMQAVLPHMISSGVGAIVNIGSTASVHGLPYAAPYTAAKHALLGLTRSAAAEYADRGITVNCICPYYVDTPMTHQAIDERMRSTGRDHEAAIRPLLSPQGRLISTDEVAATCVFLASDGGAAITGQALRVDGGKVQG
ncbi:SDR family NAD(P)-dependent oxidoreductase [Frankia sp. AgB32]|uniref:SDR family NAD(P)-dependent oxidoreductase n=1 Tax=Frankia sp. AgB32 TaxID=631119 RepID=UPI00200BB5B1|nr:SDR family oxidoreductase [Frankia sp. AgB32]MCK9897352.1 SDR family oxidoreductase [Frankia sp. AgB32]